MNNAKKLTSIQGNPKSEALYKIRQRITQLINADKKEAALRNQLELNMEKKEELKDEILEHFVDYNESLGDEEDEEKYLPDSMVVGSMLIEVEQDPDGYTINTKKVKVMDI